MDSKKFLWTIVVVAILAGGVGYAFGSTGGGVLGGDWAKLEEVKKMFPQMPDTNLISGQVKAVGDDTLTLSTPRTNPFDESPVSRQVVVTEDTKIIKNVNKSAAEMKKEQEAYQKKMSEWKPGGTSTPPTPPMPFVEETISLSDIKENDQISVEAATQIRMSEKFEAVKIMVQMSTPSAMAPVSVPVPPSPASGPAVPPEVAPVLGAPASTTTPAKQ